MPKLLGGKIDRDKRNLKIYEVRIILKFYNEVHSIKKMIR